MAKNVTLERAKKAKKDEFYTQLSDIEKELKYYKEHFRGKTVLCNCDDPRVSNFFRYFALNFDYLGLKSLITTCYKSQDIDLFTTDSCDKAVYLIYKGDKNKDGVVDFDEIDVKPLKGDGDFRSQECIELLKQADIVVTNPPFSLFREYVALLLKYEKKFLIIGDQDKIHYTDIFPHIKENRIWIGYTFPKEFKTPLTEVEDAKIQRLKEDGVYQKFGKTLWFTNLDIEKRHENLVLYKKYEKETAIKYANFDAIEIGAISDIPNDYYGIMGVPDSIVTLYNPDQFELIGIAEGDSGREIGLQPVPKELKKINPSLRDGQLYYFVDGFPKKPYSRILIRRKQNS